MIGDGGYADSRSCEQRPMSSVGCHLPLRRITKGNVSETSLCQCHGLFSRDEEGKSCKTSIRVQFHDYLQETLSNALCGGIFPTCGTESS